MALKEWDKTYQDLALYLEEPRLAQKVVAATAHYEGPPVDITPMPPAAEADADCQDLNVMS